MTAANLYLISEDCELLSCILFHCAFTSKWTEGRVFCFSFLHSYLHIEVQYDGDIILKDFACCCRTKCALNVKEGSALHRVINHCFA